MIMRASFSASELVIARPCESFYRMAELPEEVKADVAQANMRDGVIEVVLPKRTPKQKKKVLIKYRSVTPPF
ncbi:MAG: Hsp20 family protein [Candidatus Bathyarchaeia archaeon]